MKKGYIILSIMIYAILLSSFVSATNFMDDLMQVYDFEETSGELIDKIGDNDSTDNQISSKTMTGISGNAWNVSRLEKDNITLPANLINGTVAATINIWFKLNKTPSGTPYLVSTTGHVVGGGGESRMRVYGGEYKAQYSIDQVETGTTSLFNPTIDNWYMATMTYDGAEVCSYINSTLMVACAANTGPIFAGSAMGVGTRYDASTDTTMSAVLDELYIWNRALSQSEISELWNSGTGYFWSEFGEGEVSNPSFSNPTPDDDSTHNTNQTINCTHNGTDIRYYLFVNDIPYYFNVTESGTGYFNWTTNFTDGTYEYSCMVQNITTGGSGYSSNVTRTLIIDTTNPIITLNADNSFNGSNVSTTNQYADYIFFNITITDETELNSFLVNVTQNGISYYNFTNLTLTNLLVYNFTKNISTSAWPAGVYDVNVTVSDAHTASAIKDYDISQFLNRITFDTEENNEISIYGGGAYSTKYNKKKDRYEFGFNYLTEKTERTFTVKAKNKIKYLPQSKYKAHFVIWNPTTKSGNWIDFEGIGADYIITKVSDKEYDITFKNLKGSKEIMVKSIGGVNVVDQYYQLYVGNYTFTAPSIANYGSSEIFIFNISSDPSHLAINATFYYNNTIYSNTKIIGANYTSFSTTLSIPQVVGISENITFYWDIDVNQSNGNKYSFTVTDTINVSNAGIDNCTIYNITVLRIFGKDEETNEDVNTTLNIFLEVVSPIGGNSSYELSEHVNYSFCANKNFTINSIMEYGDGAVYTNKKYYLNDLLLNTESIHDVYLYHLNNTKASEVTFTVFDTTTGDKVDGAFIKILRYYPGENIFRTVEVTKTDGAGQSLGKLVLADVFYKFIIESPAGIVKLDTGVLRILSLTRSFGITFAEDYLDTWNKIHGVSYSTTCTKSTKTCRITWSDESNIVQDVTLEVWRMTGLTDQLLFSQTTVAASGTISYTITEDVEANTYVARGFIESNTGTSRYPGGTASFFYSDNPFFTDETHRIASLFPLLLLVICIVFALVDWGVLGVVVGSLLGLIIGSIVGIIPLSPFYFISFIIMGVILLYKLSK